MEIIKKKNGHREIDLAASVILLLKRAWLILLAAVMGGGLSFLYYSRVVEPEYEATATLYISNASESDIPRDVTTSDLSASMMLMYTFGGIINNEATIEEVIALSGVEYSIEQLRNMVWVSGVENTKILTLTVTSNSPGEAALLANMFAEVASNVMKTVESGSSVKVLSRAKVPDKRSAPSYSKAVLLGIVIGGFVSVLLILGNAIIDKRIRKKSDFDSLGYPVLGMIPVKNFQDNSKQAGPITSSGNHAIGKESIDTMHTVREIEENIILSLPGSCCKSILFSGVGQQEVIPKTAISVAMTMAMDNHHVLLMDCDLRNAAIKSLLGISSRPGVSNILTGQVLQQKCVHTYRSNLDVMISGTTSPNPSELLSSEEMQVLLKQLYEHYEYILLSTASIDHNRMDGTLYSKTTGTVLVIRRGVTKRNVLRETIEKLEKTGCMILGLIVVTDRS